MPIEGTSRLEQVLALEAGRAFVDLSSQRLTLVTGKDARGWLNDLVTAPVARLTPGDAVRSLLLSPTGHVRADLDIACLDEGFLLLQDPNQPDPIAELLARYVLSSHVMLADRSGTLCLLGMGSSVHPPAVDWAAAPWETDGTFAAVAAGEAAALRASIEPDAVEASREALAAWRVRRGAARFPADLSGTSVPAEDPDAEATIDFAKGCFLGQEAVAKIRNLGRPAFTIVRLWTHGRVAPGDAVFENGLDVGRVTSTAPEPPATRLLARVRNTQGAGADRQFHSAAGEPLNAILA